jgi:hypothetical protein
MRIAAASSRRWEHFGQTQRICGRNLALCATGGKRQLEVSREMNCVMVPV